MLRSMCDSSSHFTPEELARKMRREGHPISLTTIYRNLPLLVQASIIRRTDVQDIGGSSSAWYEHIWGRQHHDHLICSRCHKKVEFSYPAIDVLQEAVASDHGFKLERHFLELVGVCADCQNGQGGME